MWICEEVEHCDVLIQPGIEQSMFKKNPQTTWSLPEQKHCVRSCVFIKFWYSFRRENAHFEFIHVYSYSWGTVFAVILRGKVLSASTAGSVVLYIEYVTNKPKQLYRSLNMHPLYRETAMDVESTKQRPHSCCSGQKLPLISFLVGKEVHLFYNKCAILLKKFFILYGIITLHFLYCIIS